MKPFSFSPRTTEYETWKAEREAVAARMAKPRFLSFADILSLAAVVVFVLGLLSWLM